MSIAISNQTAMDDAVRHLVTKYSPKGSRIGWLMMASILVEAWDLYAIGFVLIFVRDQYHPDPLMLGLAAAGGTRLDLEARGPDAEGAVAALTDLIATWSPEDLVD